MKKIKLVYNIIGKFGPANNAQPPDIKTLEYVNDNKYSFWVNSYFQNVIDHHNNEEVFQLCTPYSLKYGDSFLYELPWNIWQHPENLISEMTDIVLWGIKFGKGYLLVNDAVDPLEIYRVEELLKITDANEIPREKIIFLTGAIDVDNIENPWGIKIIVADWNEIVVSTNIGQFKDVNNKSTKLNTFICLNRMWQHHRVHLLWKLWKNNLLENFAISFLKNDPASEQTYSEKLQNFATGFFTDEELSTIKQDADEIEKLLPLVVDDTSKLNTHQSHSYMTEHTRYHFYIVTETTFYNFNNSSFKGIHASEKIFKPILYKMPFIVFGPAGVLKAMRKKGYMTFGNLIDEGYDDILDDQARFAKLIEVINNISKKTKEELDEISRRAEEITEFNFNRLALRGELARHELIEKFVDIFRD